MEILFAVVIFTILLVIGVPIVFVIGITAFLAILMMGSVSPVIVFQTMFNSLDSFILLAVPLFILAANLMNSGKLSEKLISFTNSLVGHIKGGLAHSNVVVSMLFGGISGSPVADTAGLGKIFIPNMVKEGYSKGTAIAVTATSSTMGNIIPPSIGLIIYASLASTSVGALFLAGVIPGILIGLAMMVTIYIQSFKHDYPRHERVKIKEIFKRFIQILPALLTPVLIIGGIVLGIATATEAAIIACIYTFILGMFFYKNIKWKDIPEILYDTIKLSSAALFALATAGALAKFLGYFQFSKYVSVFFSNELGSTAIFMAIVVIFFLLIGTFLDATPALYLFVPLVLPASNALGIDPILLGIVITICLSIGLVTPPYGLCLLIATNIANYKTGRAFMYAIPYVISLLVVLVLIIIFPEIATWLPKLLRPDWF